MNSFEKLCANYFVRSLSCANTNTWLKENKRIGNHLRVYQSGSMCTCECLFFFPTNCVYLYVFIGDCLNRLMYIYIE